MNKNDLFVTLKIRETGVKIKLFLSQYISKRRLHVIGNLAIHPCFVYHIESQEMEVLSGYSIIDKNSGLLVRDGFDKLRDAKEFARDWLECFGLTPPLELEEGGILEKLKEYKDKKEKGLIKKEKDELFVAYHFGLVYLTEIFKPDEILILNQFVVSPALESSGHKKSKSGYKVSEKTGQIVYSFYKHEHALRFIEIWCKEYGDQIPREVAEYSKKNNTEREHWQLYKKFRSIVDRAQA